MRQKRDMKKKVAHLGSTNIRLHSIQVSRQDELAPVFCTPLVPCILVLRFLRVDQIRPDVT